MASLLIDTSAPGAQENEAETVPGSSPGGPAGVAPPVAAAAPAAAAGASCPKCSAPLAQGQDWCLQCGAGAPGGAPGTGWRPAALVLAVTAALVLGAAAAGYAALSKHSPVRKVMTATVAQAPPPATVPATPVTPTATVPTTPVSPPKIPLTAQTPTTSSTTTPSGGSESTTGGSEAGTKDGETGSGEKSGGKSGEAKPKPKPLLLDTDAASTYDPDEYPTTLFGDPSLAIDGDTSTAWTAQLDTEATVPLSAGVLLNLKSAQKLGSLGLVSATPGMTVQVFVAQVADGEEAPAKIEDPAWVADSKLIVVKKHHTLLKLTHPKQGFDYLLLWVSKAGAASAGTATAPGHVSVNEVELFRPAKKKS